MAKYTWAGGKRWREVRSSPESWPLRVVMSVTAVADVWGCDDFALHAILECGHDCYLRGDDCARPQVRCLKCAEGRI